MSMEDWNQEKWTIAGEAKLRTPPPGPISFGLCERARPRVAYGSSTNLRWQLPPSHTGRLKERFDVSEPYTKSIYRKNSVTLGLNILCTLTCPWTGHLRTERKDVFHPVYRTLMHVFDLSVYAAKRLLTLHVHRSAVTLLEDL